MLICFPGGASVKEPTCQCRRHKRCEFDPWVRKIPWRRAWQPTPVFLPGGSHGQGAWWATVHRVTELDMTERLSRHTVSIGKQHRCHLRTEIWRKERLPTPVFLPGESHGPRSLVGYSPCGRKQSNMNEQLNMLSHIHDF